MPTLQESSLDWEITEFEQWAVLAHYRGCQLPTGIDRLKQWWEVANRESVRAMPAQSDWRSVACGADIANSQEFYLERYAQLAQASKA